MSIGHTWQAFSRDTGYQLSGSLPITSAKGVLRHLGVDTAELVTPYTPAAYSRVAPGCGVVLQRDGSQQFSGMVGAAREIGWDSSTGQPIITLSLLGDDQHLDDRLVWPSPAAAVTAQTADYWTYTGAASTAMWQLILQQAGAGAQASRQVPTLVMGTDPAVGVSRLWSGQFMPVLELLTTIGLLSGLDLGVRVVTTSDGLRADLYVPRDVSGEVRFSASLANLTGWGFTEQPPTVTVAIAAGQGDLHTRVRRVASSAAAGDLAWGRRIEQLIDQRDEADVTKLQQAATDGVAQGVGSRAITLTAQDSPGRAYGKAWGLGDRVTVHVGLPGGPTAATVTDLVREVAFEVDAKGQEKITPAVGTNDAQALQPGPTQAVLEGVAAGLARLTRNK